MVESMYFAYKAAIKNSDRLYTSCGVA